MVVTQGDRMKSRGVSIIYDVGMSIGHWRDLIRAMAKRRPQTSKSFGPTPTENEIFELLSSVPEPWQESKRDYPLVEILFLVVAATLSGLNDFTGIARFGMEKLEWLRQFMPYKNGTPSHDPIGRAMGLVCPDALENMFSSWMETVDRIEGVIAIDGKTARGARGPGDKMALVHMVSAFTSENGVVLGQLKTDEKSNEITAIPRLLDALHLAGATVTIDAGGCHTKIMNTIKERNADFVIAVKDNQATLLDDCRVAFHDVEHDIEFGNETAKRDVTQARAHGRGERRVCEAVPAKGRLTHADKWSAVKTMIRVTSTRTIKGKAIDCERFYGSSRTLAARQAQELIRAHWSIENSLHWCLDMQFDEDRNRVHTRNAAENFRRAPGPQTVTSGHLHLGRHHEPSPAVCDQ